jgi:hypothetical protein
VAEFHIVVLENRSRPESPRKRVFFYPLVLTLWLLYELSHPEAIFFLPRLEVAVETVSTNERECFFTEIRGTHALGKSSRACE